MACSVQANDLRVARKCGPRTCREILQPCPHGQNDIGFLRNSIRRIGACDTDGANIQTMSVDEVEKVAQGRVWTGEQAKEVGLVDRLGGLDMAISYAKSSHTQSESVDVEYWPRKKSFWDLVSGKESLAGIISEGASLVKNSSDETESIVHLLKEMSELKFAERPHFMLTIDEKTALDLILRGD